NQIGFLDGLNGFRQRANITWQKRKFFDGRVAGGDSRFAVHLAAVFENSDQRYVGNRGWKNAAANGQNFAADANRLREIAGYVRERREKQVAKIVAHQAAASVKTILKEPAEQSFVLRERHHAVTDVAGRKDTVFAAQAAGAAPVVSDGNDCGEVAYRLERAGAAATISSDVFLQTAKKRGETGTAAEGNDVEAAGCFG